MTESSPEQSIVTELANNRGEIISYLRKRGVSENLIEDVAQEAFIRAQKAAPEFKGGSTLNWQSSIAWNVYLDMVRKKDNRVNLHQEVTDEALKKSIDDRTDTSGMSISAYDQLISKEEVAQLLRAVDKLPDEQKQVMILHIDGKSDQEIAEILSISYANVRVIMHRSRKKLSELFNLERD